MIPWFRRSVPLVAALVALAAPRPAAAAADDTFTYDSEIVWSTAVRLLRVDLGHRIVEQDRDNGYLLFVVEQNGREYNGSMEMVQGTGEYGTAIVEVIINLHGLPRSVEDQYLRKLRTKLREQFGAAPRPTRPEPVVEPEPEPDEAPAEPTERVEPF